MWVAELGKEHIIGQVFVQLKSSRSELADGIERAYIYGFRVKPDYRRNGLGTWMILTIENELINRKYKIVCLNVACDNPEARLLYENLGYRLVGLDPSVWSYIDEKGIRQEVKEPAWRMEKHL